jgi:hypothetical protein
MGAFVVAEAADGVGQIRFAVAQFLQLLGIVAVDLGLDRGGAGHGRLGAKQRGGRAQGEAGNRPHRMQRGGAHAMLRDHRVERGAVILFLPGHFHDLGRIRAAIAHHRQLPGIDARGAEFAGLVHPDHPGDFGAQCLGGAGHRIRLLAAALGQQSQDRQRGRCGKQEIEAGHAHAPQGPGRHVAAHQRRGHDRGQRIAVDVAGRAGGDAFPPVIFDPGVKRADQPAGQDAERGQQHQPAPFGPAGRAQQRQHAQRNRGKVAIALPPAHFARRQAKAVLRHQRGAHGDERNTQGQRAGQGEIGRRTQSGHRSDPLSAQRLRSAARAPGAVRLSVWTA